MGHGKRTFLGNINEPNIKSALGLEIDIDTVEVLVDVFSQMLKFEKMWYEFFGLNELISTD